MNSYANRRVSVLRRLHLTDPYGLTIGAFLLLMLAGIAAFAAIVVVIAVGSSRAVGRTTCRNFAAQTGFQTKFRVLNFFDTGHCLAKAPNGKWVLNSRIYQFLQETKR